MAIITLLTDFGMQDGFVGTMKGVICSIHPQASIVDITHDIPPQDIREAAFVLRNAYGYFPPGTIHVAVVDPGVGSARHPVVVETARYLFVGPDNGLFAYIYRMEQNARVTAITNTAYCLPRISRTFHGRDVFAPVAGHLAAGVKPADCGPPLADYVRGEVSEPDYRPDRIAGHVLHVDRFGNLITDIPEEAVIRYTAKGAFRVEVGKIRLDRLCGSYAEVPPGHPLAIIGSAGLLEIAVNGGEAAARLDVRRGDPVTLVVNV
jgi:S-adenosylmethionine hydrolase